MMHYTATKLQSQVACLTDREQKSRKGKMIHKEMAREVKRPRKCLKGATKHD